MGLPEEVELDLKGKQENPCKKRNKRHKTAAAFRIKGHPRGGRSLQCLAAVEGGEVRKARQRGNERERLGRDGEGCSIGYSGDLRLCLLDIEDFKHGSNFLRFPYWKVFFFNDIN